MLPTEISVFKEKKMHPFSRSVFCTSQFMDSKVACRSEPHAFLWSFSTSHTIIAAQLHFQKTGTCDLPIQTIRAVSPGHPIRLVCISGTSLQGNATWQSFFFCWGKDLSSIPLFFYYLLFFFLCKNRCCLSGFIAVQLKCPSEPNRVFLVSWKLLPFLMR